MRPSLPWDGEVARAVRDLEFGPDAASQDAEELASRELAARLRGNGAPVVLSAPLTERLAAWSDAPAPFWTQYEPDTVASLHTLSAGAGAEAVVSNTAAPLAVLEDEGLCAEQVWAKGAWLAAHAPAPYAVLAVSADGLGPEHGPAVRAAASASTALLLCDLPDLVTAADLVAAWGLLPDIPVVATVRPDGLEGDRGAAGLQGVAPPSLCAVGVQAPFSVAQALTCRYAPLVAQRGLGWAVVAQPFDGEPAPDVVAWRALFAAGATAVCPAADPGTWPEAAAREAADAFARP